MARFEKNGQNGATKTEYPEQEVGQIYIKNPEKETNDSSKETSLDALSPKSLKNNYPTDRLMENIEELKNKIIQKFENNSSGSNYWKSLGGLAELVGLPPSKVEYVMENSEPNSLLGSFIQNVRGFWTTRNLYEKHTPFLRKIYDAYSLRFN